MGVARGETGCFILILHWLQGHKGKSVSASPQLNQDQARIFFVIQLGSVESYSLMNKGIVSPYWNLLIAPKTPHSTIVCMCFFSVDLTYQQMYECCIHSSVPLLAASLGEIMTLVMMLLRACLMNLSSDLSGLKPFSCDVILRVGRCEVKPAQAWWDGCLKVIELRSVSQTSICSFLRLVSVSAVLATANVTPDRLLACYCQMLLFYKKKKKKKHS